MLMDEAIASSRLDWLLPQADSLGDFVFFRPILSYLRNAVADFGIELMGRSMQWVGGIALTLLTLWILVQGYPIVTGQSRSSMMALVTHSLRAVLILTAATTMAMFGSGLHEFLNKDLRDAIHHVVAGGDESPEDNIDKSLAWMQVAFSSIDALDVMGDTVLDREKTQALWFIGLGTGGPAITAGTLLLLYEIAIALFIGFGPLFILCLLFDQTKALFEKWLLYGIGTLFSMAVLSAMVSIALEMVVRVAAAFWGTALAGSLLGSDFTDGMTSVAMQQGGLGLVLTLLIISTPPMAAAFFNGALGQFMPFSAFGGGGAGRRGASGGGYAGGHQEASQEFHPAQHHFRQTLSAEVNPDQIKRMPVTHETQHVSAPTADDIERRILVELATQDAAASGILLAQVRGGPARMPPPGIPIAENRGWDAALNIAADPLGLLEPYYATRAAMAQMDDVLRKQRVDQFRQGMIEAGVKDVPKGYDRAWVEGGQQVNDYNGTLNKLANHYMDHLQDHRLREMWGDNYKDIRLGKSQMNVLEFEKWVLDSQQKAIDVAYSRGIEAIRSGEIKFVDGRYSRELGNYIDRQARLNLRLHAKDEGINDDGPSKIWAINRRIQIDTVQGYGVPDNRIGYNLYADTTLARKTADWEQVQRWNTIRPGHTIVIRPTQVGGSYVIPRTQIPEYSPLPTRARGK